MEHIQTPIYPLITIHQICGVPFAPKTPIILMSVISLIKFAPTVNVRGMFSITAKVVPLEIIVLIKIFARYAINEAMPVEIVLSGRMTELPYPKDRGIIPQDPLLRDDLAKPPTIKRIFQTIHKPLPLLPIMIILL